MPAKSVSRESTSPAPSKKYFDIDEANRSIVYVGKIVDDICETYQAALRIQQRRDDLVAEHAEPLRREYDETVRKLNAYVEELHSTGVELKDYEVGLVDFPARHDGRAISLCWRRGEKEILAWHETDEGFANRQPLDLLEPVEAE